MSKLYDLLSAMCGKIKKPDWNQNDSAAADYVKNRPFYKDTVFDITWDGNTDGLEQFKIEDLCFYKVSDNIPEVTDIAGSTLSFDINNNKDSCTIVQSMIRVGTNFLSVTSSLDLPSIVFIYEDQTDLGGVVANRGCWFLKYGVYTILSIKKIGIKTIDTECLPEIPAEKLPEIPTIELTTNITDSIASDTQPLYSVKNLSYSDLLEIFNRGIFAFKDSHSMYYPLKTSVDTSGNLSATILTNEVLKQSLVYAILVCSNSRTVFYRNSYRTISETT